MRGAIRSLTVIAGAALMLGGCSSAGHAVGRGSGSTTSRAVGNVTTWGFDSSIAGEAPDGFTFARTGSGADGEWSVLADPTAPSPPNVLAQLSDDPTDLRFPVAVADAPITKDVSVSVACKPVSGVGDQACGLVFRYIDANTYYIVRANALEDNVNFYYVKGGVRIDVAGWNGPVRSGVWQNLRVDARGDHIEVYWQGARVLDVRDSTYSDAGKIGVWTKADSVTYFDDLTVTEL